MGVNRPAGRWGIMAAMNDSRYAELQDALLRCNALTDAAEAHGTLTGGLCAARSYSLRDWLADILPDGQATGVAQDCLQSVYTLTSATLAAGQMQFVALLPDDDEALAVRTAALGEWCQGMLYGLGSGRLQDPAALGGEVSEIIRDFTAITQVDVDPEDDAEASEAAYMELVEFIRVGTQLLFEQLEPLREPPAAPPGVPFH